MRQTDFTAIELLVLDVDGVLTDGGIRLTDGGEEIKVFHVRDGTGMKYWKRAGGKLAMLTGRQSAAALRRAEELGVDAVRTGAKDKLPVYREILAELGAAEERAAVVGDDLPDLPLFAHCGLAVAVADAAAEVRQAADLVTQARGGQGAVRETIELILRRAGKWEGILARYRRGGEANGP